MVDMDCRGCMFFKVKTQQILRDGDWKLDIKIKCEADQNKLVCEKEKRNG